MIFNGLLSLFLYLFYLGSFVSLILTPNNHKKYFLNLTIISIIASLYLSWFIVFVNIIFGFKVNIFYLYFIVTLANCYLIYNKNFNLNYFNFKDLILFFLFLTIFTNFIRTPDFIFTFNHGDAVLSYNRWAIEIYENKINNLFGYYPLLWPGVWSLIYDSQGNANFWIFTKLSVLIVPFLYLLINFKFLYNKRYLEFYFFIVIFFQVFLQWPFKVFIFSGYMDNLVTLLSIILFMMILDNFINNPKKIEYNLFALSLLTGLISITKFSGMFTMFFYWYFLYYLKKKKIIKKNFTRLNFITSIIPSILFLIIYLIVQDFSLKNNNIIYLLNNSAKEAYHNIFLTSFLRIFQIINPFLLLLMISLSLINFFKKDDISKLGKNFFIIFILGILIFSTVSYDNRNSFYLIFFLIISSYCSLNRLNFKKKILKIKRLKRFFFIIIFSTIIIFSITIDKFMGNYLIYLDNQKIKNMEPLTCKIMKFKDCNKIKSK